jgi:hypothetical protein
MDVIIFGKCRKKPKIKSLSAIQRGFICDMNSVCAVLHEVRPTEWRDAYEKLA